jgi:pimeloyl-ACP methyl ester carboxylesterase
MEASDCNHSKTSKKIFFENTIVNFAAIVATIGSLLFSAAKIAIEVKSPYFWNKSDPQHSHCNNGVHCKIMPNPNIPNRSLHNTYETLAKGLSGNDFANQNITKAETLTLFEQNGYVIDRVFNTAATDFQAVGLRSTNNDRPPLLIFAGTTSPFDEQENKNPQGAGFNQFNENKTAIENWLTTISQDTTKNPQKLLPDVTGYSLGAALVQWTAATYPNKISEAVTFHSFGLNRGVANTFKQNGGVERQVTHYVSNGDLVSLQGEEFVPGTVVLANYTTTAIDPQRITDKHFDDLVIDASASQPTNLSYQEISTDTFNNPNFTYSSRDWNDFLIAARQSDPQFAQSVNNRQAAEGLRKQLSYFELVSKIEGIDLNKGYTTATSSGFRANPGNNILEVTSGASTQNIKITPLNRSGNLISEIGVFKVDDDRGSINGVLPGNIGYLRAALERSQVVFSNLKGDFFTSANQRQLSVNLGDRLQFYSVQDSTTDQALQNLRDGANLPPILFANPTANSNSNFTKIEADSSSVKFGWNDANNGQGNFQDLVLKVEKIDATSIVGNQLQGREQGELIDLRNSLGTRRINVNIGASADYNNSFGLYAIDDESGKIGNLNPGDAGYAEAALRRAIVNLDKNANNSQRELAGGGIYAPFLVANGSIEDFLAKNPTNAGGNNLPRAYFNYLGANTDRVDHVRLLGDNKFGFEDLFGGGDRDYNDFVVQFNVQ